MEQLKVIGNSKDIIEFCTYNNNFAIKKISNNIRLKKQINKQEKDILINTPKILEKNFDILPYYVIMEYIPNASFFDYLTLDNYKLIITDIINYIKDEYNNSTLKTIQKNILINKWQDIKNNFSTYSLSKNLINKIDIIFNSLTDLTLPIGKCHGDLTFSNILYNNKIYLIDYLDSFIESPLIDIIKLRQDTKYKWSLFITGKRFNQNIFNLMDIEIINSFNINIFEYNILELMNFLRIIPYCKNEKMLIYLEKTINEIIKGL